MQPGGRFHYLDQPGRIERLGHVGVHSRGEASVAVAFHAVRRQGDDRACAFRGSSPIPGSARWPPARPCRASARPSGPRRKSSSWMRCERPASGGRHRDLVAALFKQLAGQPLIHRVVFGQQNAQIGQPVRALKAMTAVASFRACSPTSAGCAVATPKRALKWNVLPFPVRFPPRWTRPSSSPAGSRSPVPAPCRRICAWWIHPPAGRRRRSGPVCPPEFPRPSRAPQTTRSRHRRRVARSARRTSRRTEIEIPPWSVNLMALPSRFSRIWRKRSGSPTSRSGTSSATDKEYSSFLFAICKRQHAPGLLQAVLERKIDGIQVQTPGFDLGEIQDVVQNGEQEIGGEARRFHILALLVGELRGQNQIGHAQHSVHRSSDLVAHVGQKLALVTADFLGLIEQPLNFLLLLIDHGFLVLGAQLFPWRARGSAQTRPLRARGAPLPGGAFGATISGGPEPQQQNHPAREPWPIPTRAPAPGSSAAPARRSRHLARSAP